MTTDTNLLAALASIALKATLLLAIAAIIDQWGFGERLQPLYTRSGRSPSLEY